MPGFSLMICCGFAIFALAGCGAPAVPAASPLTQTPAAQPGSNEQLSQLADRYWSEHLDSDYAISTQYLADSLSVERRYLAAVLKVPRDDLDAAAALTYDIFRRQRELAVEAATFPGELLPINPYAGKPQQFAAQTLALARQPNATAADFENWLRQLDEYVSWTQQAIVNMREGTRRGYVAPLALIERMLPVLDRLAADDSANALYAPLRSLPETIKEPARGQLAKALSSAVSQRLLPANRALRQFLQQEYLPRARPGIALSELPLGMQWYAYRVKRAVGAAISADELARIGVAEVERLGALMPHDAAPAVAGAPHSGTELVSAYQELGVRVRTAVPTLFSAAPTADFDMRAAESLPVPASALYYEPAGLSGTDTPVLYVYAGRTASKVSIAEFLQQAVPGHHFQMALEQERSDLPRFRRFGTDPAFTEGWGLYAVTLGEELGIYQDEPAKQDALGTEMRCAVALVVDPGIHAMGWTRGRALDYLRAHLTIDDVDAQALIDWYAANPADALACTMGALKFRALRVRTQQSMGPRFDVREYHTEILRDGAMPMDLLEAKIKMWAGASR